MSKILIVHAHPIKPYLVHTMVAIPLESRASIATTASPLTSSFLPKCTHLLQAQLPHRPPVRLSFHGVAASTKQKKKVRSSSSAREWSYEHLMVVWDEVFEQCCTDSVKATKIKDLSYRGLSKHGRGCVLVFQEVQTRPRGSGTGFTSKPPKSSRRVPDFVTLDWYAAYLPREFLLDPRKAPNEDEMTPQGDETSSDAAAQVAETCKESNDDDAARMVDTQRGDVTIDVEEIIRSAQDVYQFGSDDDDDDDDDDGLDVRADLNNDSLLILDDKEDAYAASRIESLLNPDEEDNDIATAASVSNDVYEGPLVIFDDDELVVTTPPKVETQSSREIRADGAYLNSANVPSQANFGPEDGAVEIVHSTLIETEEEHSEYHVIDDIHSGKERSKMQFDLTGGATASLSASGLDDEASGKDGGADGDHSASVLNEGCGYTVELLEEITEVDASSLKGSAANENASMGGEGMQDQGDGQSEDDLELVTQQMLFTSMRGMDMTRLLSLTANFDFEAKTFRFGRKTAMIDSKTMDAGGEDPYNPKEDELVLLLHLVIDGRPAYGADVVVAYKDETQIVGLEKDAWKLKGKYKI